MDLKPRVGPLEHPLGLVVVEEAAAHEEPKHGPPEGLRERGGVMPRPPRPAHEGPIGPEAPIGDDQLEMRMPVGKRAVSLEAGDDSDAEVRLAGGSADGGGDGAGGHPGKVA
jgi:hypothetical protein